jgi:hypothetical protein
MTYQDVVNIISQESLRCCGGFYPEPTDGLADELATAIIVGNAGNSATTSFWATFMTNHPDSINTLDDWTKKYY